ncbi:MAG TPA: hypothetical protein VFK91_03090 [Methyloceanibacter sp.]|nr:hypothetical protein [Methyloceanibacter sp.]
MRAIHRLSPLLLAFALWSEISWAQEVPAAPSKPNPLPTPPMSPKLIDFFSAKTPYEFWLTCVILAAGLLFTYLAVRFLRQIHREELEHATRAMTILFVIMATMVLITAGYNNEQIAPAFGLFGTIVGYILGRGEKAGERPGGPDVNGNSGLSPGPTQNPPAPVPTPPPAPLPELAGSSPPTPSAARNVKK